MTHVMAQGRVFCTEAASALYRLDAATILTLKPYKDFFHHSYRDTAQFRYSVQQLMVILSMFHAGLMFPLCAGVGAATVPSYSRTAPIKYLGFHLNSLLPITLFF